MWVIYLGFKMTPVRVGAKMVLATLSKSVRPWTEPMLDLALMDLESAASVKNAFDEIKHSS